MPCLLMSSECVGRTHAHHHRKGTDGGMGLKPSDRNAVNLCMRHHSEGHTIGWKAFEAKHKVDLGAEAIRLANLSPHL